MRRMVKAVLGVTVAASALAAATGVSYAGVSEKTPSVSHVDSAAAVRKAALDGSLTRTHPMIDVCPADSGNKYLPTGCDLSLVATSGNAAKPLESSGPVGLGPADFARAFNLPDGSGQAGTIGIVGFGATPTLAADLAQYRSAYGLPACTEESGCLQIVGQNGGAPPAPLGLPVLNKADEGLAFESTIDVDMASAACPSCQIRVVELSPLLTIPQYASLPAETAKAMDDGVDTAIKLGANAVSMSYNVGNGLQPGIATDPLAQRLHHPGVAIVASSGDHGVQQGTANQTWPQELPWVTSAGGVQLTSSDDGTSFTKATWDTGTALNDGAYWSAGSACSSYIAPAIGQPAGVAANCGGHRASSDVSAPAANVSVYDTYLPASGGAGGWGIAVGTSAASPFLAGLYARAGTTGVDGPNTVYAAAGTTSIEDVTTGTNMANGASDCTKANLPTALCVAGPGWDGPTGVGVPNGLDAF
jgi:subtilase family serine protease